MVNKQQVLSVLESINDPLMQKNYIALNAVDSVEIENGLTTVAIKLGARAASLENKTSMVLKAQLEAAGIKPVEVTVCSDVLAFSEVNTQKHLSGVKNIVMVASGKGGVGKSTTAVNLSLALHAEGAKVGLLDADIYGPSQCAMLGADEDVKPEVVDYKFIKPVERFGIKSMSVGYLAKEKAPMIWRGSMAVRALQQLMEQTIWGDIDYLIIDMPPGTGDIQISLAQTFHVAGAVIVTTPQEIALLDARKGIDMFKKVGIPVLGICENMSTHICSNCGHEESIFGAGGAATMAQDYSVPLLGSLPLDARIREDVDQGLPTVVSDPMGALANSYTALAHQVAAQLWKSNLAAAQSPMVVISED
jgi:ATP-binding protein involved in chromosome partitioning